MLISSYFANCIPSSMVWTAFLRGKDFKDRAEGLREKAFAEVLLPILFHLEPNTAAVCRAPGWISHGKGHLRLRRERGFTGTCVWMELSLSASGFVFIPTHPFSNESDLTWVTVNNFPLMAQLWNDTCFFSFSPSAKIHGHLKCCLNKHSSSENMMQFFQSLVLGCGEWLFCFVCDDSSYLYLDMWHCKRTKTKEAFTVWAKLLLGLLN